MRQGTSLTISIERILYVLWKWKARPLASQPQQTNALMNLELNGQMLLEPQSRPGMNKCGPVSASANAWDEWSFLHCGYGHDTLPPETPLPWKQTGPNVTSWHTWQITP